MTQELQKETILHSNNDYLYPEEIIGQYVMELPIFDNKKANSTQNQQRKKKVLKPIRIHTLSATRRRQCMSNSPYQTTYTNHTGTHSKTSNVNNLLNDDHTFRIKQLENKLVEAHMKIRDIITENRLLKTLEKRHENALSMYEGKQAKLPQVIKSYEDDIRILQSRIRQMKISYNEMENRYKSQSTEFIVLQKQYKHLLNLSKNKELSKREKLSDQLEEAQHTIKQQDNKIQNLMKQLDLQNKTHRHHINSGNIKVKELQLEIKRLNDANQNLGPHLGKLNTKKYSARQIFAKGITEDSISITPRAVKHVPTIHEQGDGINESFNKTNESISLKPEPLHKENEDDYSIRQIKSNTNNIMSNALSNNKPYSSNMSSSTTWLNRGLAKLSKENKTELSNIIDNDFENHNEDISSKHFPITETLSMSRTQKDLLLAKLNQVSEDKDDYENYYKSKLLNQSDVKRYSSFDSNDVSDESSTSD